MLLGTDYRNAQAYSNTSVMSDVLWYYDTGIVYTGTGIVPPLL